MTYQWLALDYPTNTTLQQLHNTIEAYRPDLTAMIEAVERGEQKLLEDIERYPAEAERLARALPYVQDFYRNVQAMSDLLDASDARWQAAKARLDLAWEEHKRKWQARHEDAPTNVAQAVVF